MRAAKSLMPPRTGSEAVTLMGRLGYIARGVVYLLVGASAAIAAIWPAHRPAGPSDAVQLGSAQLDGGQFGHGHPIGAIFLIAVALGLACLAGWFTIAGLMTARRGGGRGWWRGLGMLGDAIVYVFFMIDVAGIALGLWRGGGDRNVQSWIAWLSAWDYGRPLIGVIGAVVLVGGAGLLVWGIIGNVDREVALPQQEKRLIRPVARYGIAGRGAAVALVGCFLIAAAFYGNPREAHEVGGMLAALRHVTYGRVLIGLFGLAFIGSSLFDFVAAFYRRFDPAEA
jgi:uncharacterized protein DUF1206